MHFGPCYMGSKGLQQACNKLKSRHGGGGSFRKTLVRPRIGKWAESPFLFVRSDLQYQQIEIDALCSLLSGIQSLTASLYQARIKQGGGGNFREAPIHPRVGILAESPSLFCWTC